MQKIAAFAFSTALYALTPSAYAQVTTHTTFTATDPVYQLPVTVDVAVTNPPPISCAVVGGCQPNQIQYAVSTQGLLFDAQLRVKRPTSVPFDPQVHFEKLTSTVTTSPGQFLTTTIYRLSNTFPDNTQTRLEIRCQRASTVFKAYAPQGVSITYEVVGLTSVTHPITAQSCPPL